MFHYLLSKGHIKQEIKEKVFTYVGIEKKSYHEGMSTNYHYLAIKAI